MPIYKDPEKLKVGLHEVLLKLNQFNEWERRLNEKPDMATCLSAVFELYDLIPEKARIREVNAEGIMKMHKGLACLA